MGGSKQSQPLRIEGCEVPAYYVPVNQFVAEHPSFDGYESQKGRIHSGELQPADLSDSEVARQFGMLAGNFSDILLHAGDESLRDQACDAVLETVVRLQNPKYATDQVEVRTEAKRLHDEYEARRVIAKAMRAPFQAEDASDELLEDFEIYVTGEYDLKSMRERAALTLAPMIKPTVSEAFTEVTGVPVESATEPEVEPVPVQPAYLRRKLGALASRLSVGFSSARAA